MNKNEMLQIDPKDFIDRCYIEMKYCDSDGWTVPIIMTEERLKKVYDDLSIEKIRLTTNNVMVYELDVL